MWCLGLHLGLQRKILIIAVIPQTSNKMPAPMKGILEGNKVTACGSNVPSPNKFVSVPAQIFKHIFSFARMPQVQFSSKRLFTLKKAVENCVFTTVYVLCSGVNKQIEAFSVQHFSLFYLFFCGLFIVNVRGCLTQVCPVFWPRLLYFRKGNLRCKESLVCNHVCDVRKCVVSAQIVHLT